MNSKLAPAVAAILAVAALTAQTAAAQEAQSASTGSAKADAADVGEVVVTGSRIRRPNLDSAVPITSVAVDEIIDQGDVSLGDALNDLPSLRSTYSSGNSTRFIGTAGLNLLDLRGLGTERTLVLVNGRRHITASPGDYLVDVNTIPSELIDRVDVVTGGNSAIYGSDAVAGVVNFIMKRDFEGVAMRAQTGISSESDRAAHFASITAGTNFADGRGNVAIALEYSRQDPLYFNQRDALTGAFSGRSQYNTAEPIAGELPAGDGIPDSQFFTGVFNGNIANGGLVAVNASAATCNPASTALTPDQRAARCLPNGQPRLFSFNSAGNLVESVPVTDFRPFGSGNVVLASNPGGLSTLRDTGQLAAGINRKSVNVLAHFDVNDAFKPFVEAKFVRIEAVQEGQPSFWQGSIPGFFGGGVNLSCSNPFLNAGSLATLQTLGRCATPTATFNISRFNVDFGGRGELHERDTVRLVLGATGTFNDDWTYEVAVNYGRFKSKLDSLNNLRLFDLDGNDDGFLLAIDAQRNGAGQIVCGINNDADPSNDRPDCVPINVLGIGAPSAAALAFVNTTGHRDEKAEQYVANAFVSGDSSQWFELPGGPIGFAIGAEYRKEKAESVFDELTAFGGTFLNAIQPFLPPDLTVKEYFGEIRLPLLKELPFVEELTLEAAGRKSKYNNDTGTVSAYNVGGVWSPVKNVRFRGNYGTSVRAPTQSDLYSPFSQNFAFLNDPCDINFINQNPNRAANCAAAGVPVGFVNQPARDASTAFVSGGNPTLVEEEGESYTIGAVFTPDALPGFSLSIDYYNIEVTGLIATVAAQTILNECYNSTAGLNNPFCGTVNRNPDSTFADPAVISGGVNFAKQETQGVDMDMSYRHTFENGHRFNSRVIATYVLKVNNYTNPALPDVPNRQLSELGDPQVSFNVNLGYGVGKLDLDYNLRYIGKQVIAATYEAQNGFDGLPPTNADAFPRIYYPSVVYHNIRGEYEFNDKVSVYAGIDNVADKMPPLGLLGTGAGDPFDATGRYFYMGAKYDF